MPGIELFGAEERREVQDVLETGVLFRYNHDAQRNGHWKTRTLEQEFAAWHGAPYCHAVANGTAAIMTALAACGVGAEDEVIVPPFTFIATIEAVLMLGAVPVFAEIDDTLNLCPEGVRAAITPRTKAVALVHMCGSPPRLDALMEVCMAHNVTLVEDTAQALGATYNGKLLGTFGKAGSYSFDYFKIITAGEGGAIVTSDPEVYAFCHPYADHGHDHEGDNRGMEGHPILGFNFRMGEINAAIALAQFRKLGYMLERQRAHRAQIADALGRFDDVTFRHVPAEADDAATFFSFFLPDEARARAVMQAMGAAGVDGLAYWYDNNYHYLRNWGHFKALKAPYALPQKGYAHTPDYTKVETPQSDALMRRLISMTIKVTWTEAELADRLERMAGVLRGAGVPA